MTLCSLLSNIFYGFEGHVWKQPICKNDFEMIFDLVKQRSFCLKKNCYSSLYHIKMLDLSAFLFPQVICYAVSFYHLKER